MRTPCIIAARNEAECLASTLSSLPTSVEPIVIPNGCTDQTETIARNFGATVLESDSTGKMPAIQEALTYLRDEALDPLMILDADTRPLFGSRWLATMFKARQRIPESKPAMVIGALAFSDTDVLTGIWRNLAHTKKQIITRNTGSSGEISGGNALLHLNSRAALQRVLDMPNVWPGEDKAMADIVLDEGGEVIKTVSPRALAITSARRFPSVKRRLKNGRDKYIETIHASYLSDAPEDSIAYKDPKNSSPNIAV